ncbi:MAG: hypothetical protein GY752_04575 [bacterium]|nr:hypothetical protein [bacterium]MCP4799707.1 hypothetical protein [bacterium]
MSNSIDVTAFENEVRRWNKQFSLISRQNSEVMLQQLICESLDSYAAFMNWVEINSLKLDSFKQINYYDIGSGAGFPGILWQSLFERDFGSIINGHLVEPREKRAWFLERCSRMQGHTKLRVVNDRWKKQPLMDTCSQSKSINIISIKALFLTDADIVKEIPNQNPVLICRFHNPQTALDDCLRENLKLPDNAQMVNFSSSGSKFSIIISKHTNCST